MKLYYIANNRIPTDRAHGVQIVEMCSAFAKAGAEVTLVIPRIGREDTNLFAAYGVAENFSVARLPVINLPLIVPGAFALRTFSFAHAVRAFLALEEKEALVYTRGEMALFFANSAERFSFVWEAHIKPQHSTRYRAAVVRALALVVVTKHFAEEIPRLWSVPAEKILYVPDGVALEPFSHLPERAEARRELGLPLDKRLVVYVGSDLVWKGLRLLRTASDRLPETVLTAFVGAIRETGTPSARRLFAGVQPYTKIPLWLAAADVLVLTGEPESEIARYYTSPLKLFEYMASERPIVATDLPAVRDVLSEREAYLAEPTAAGIATAIEDALTHPEEAARRVRAARAAVEHYSWDTRARAILAFVSARTPRV